MPVFWDIAPSLQMFQRCLLPRIIIALMMEAASTSETSIDFYQILRRNIPEESLHTRRRENLKSHLV
jgi:hypothetical protein